MRILITGGDHTGKDSLAHALVRENSSLKYTSASSLLVASLVEEWKDGRDIKAWWDIRRDHRQEWIDAFDVLRQTHRPAIFATYLFTQGESIVTGIRFTSELIDLLTTNLKPHIILWCRYAHRCQSGPGALTLDLTTQLAAISNVPVMTVWSETQAPVICRILKALVPDKPMPEPNININIQEKLT